MSALTDKVWIYPHHSVSVKDLNMPTDPCISWFNWILSMRRGTPTYKGRRRGKKNSSKHPFVLIMRSLFRPTKSTCLHQATHLSDLTAIKWFRYKMSLLEAALPHSSWSAPSLKLIMASPDCMSFLITLCYLAQPWNASLFLKPG